MGISIGYVPPSRKRAAKPKVQAGAEPCFHTIAPRLKGAIMEAVIEQDPKNGFIYTSIGFGEGEPPEDNPDAGMFAYMWWSNEGKIILAECLYKIEKPAEQ